MRHIVSASDFTTEDIVRLFERAREMKRDRLENAYTLSGKILASVFYEPSTRTRFSFESAMLRLGGSVLSTENAEQFSSAKKGETLEDSIRVLSTYANVIVLRHPENGSALRASTVSSVPLINGGDGKNEHPTQALLDLFTIWEAVTTDALPSKELHVLFFGDNMSSRTVRSLAYLLKAHSRKLGFPVTQITFFGLNDIGRPPSKLLAHLVANSGITVTCTTQDTPYAREAFKNFDVAYITRSQRERHQEGEGSGTLIFSPDFVGELPEHAIIMHPLPRTEELPEAVDADVRARYFEQAENGLYVRMALLEMLLS